MRRVLFSASMALLAMMVLMTPAMAGRRWCARDPIVKLNGQDLQVWVAVPEEYVYLVNGPVSVTYSIPSQVSRSVVFTDEGFNGHGEVVHFKDDSKSRVSGGGVFGVDISVTVPIDTSLAQKNIKARKIPLQITVIEDNQTKVVEMWNTGAWISTNVKGQQ